MSRLLTLILIVVLTVTQGHSVAAAMCRHQSRVEHAAALQSRDSKVSAVALNEEAAGDVASKRAPPADSGSFSWASDMLPAPRLAEPFRVNQPLELTAADPPILVGANVRPLLEPPSA